MDKNNSIIIRPLRAFDELRAVVELQKTYWGHDLESVIPTHMLFSIANSGGHVLTAFDGDKPIGCLVGFLGTNTTDPDRPAMANLQVVSKRMVVLPEYRSHGVGYRLKVAQRELAIQAGIRLVVWTFDPLLSSNAHLNIRKLGAVCPRYVIDYYGTNPDGGLVSHGTSDRLMVEWWITHRRVDERLTGSRSPLTFAKYREADTIIMNPPNLTDDGVFTPAPTFLPPKSSLALIEIPTNFTIMAENNAALAKAWRRHIREAFQSIISQGYIVTDFVREHYDGHHHAFYVLSYNGPQFESFRVDP